MLQLTVLHGHTSAQKILQPNHAIRTEGEMNVTQIK